MNQELRLESRGAKKHASPQPLALGTDACFLLLASTRHAFTLVESLVYSALLAFFIGAAFIVTTQVLENARKDRSKLEVSEEAEFIMKKIEWALIDASTTTIPMAGTSSSTLKVLKYGFAENPLEFRLQDESVELKRSTGAFTRLNNTRVKVTGLTFEHTRDDTNEQSLVDVTLTVENKPEEEETIFEASTTLQSTFRI